MINTINLSEVSQERIESLYYTLGMYAKTNDRRNLSINALYSTVDNLIYIEDADNGAEILYCMPHEWTALRKRKAVTSC